MVLFSPFLRHLRHLHQLTSPSGLWSLCHRRWHPHGLSQSSATGTSRHVWKTRCWGPQEYHGIAIAWCQKRPAVVWKRLGLVCARENQLVCACGSLTRPCTRISSSLQWNLRYFTLTFSIVLYHSLRYFTLLHCTLLHYSGSGLQTSELLLYFSAAPLHSRLLRYFSTSGWADFIHCTLLFSPLYSTLRSATLLYCATHYSTLFYFTLLFIFYSYFILFYSTQIYSTLLCLI